MLGALGVSGSLLVLATPEASEEVSESMPPVSISGMSKSGSMVIRDEEVASFAMFLSSLASRNSSSGLPCSVFRTRPEV